MTGFDKAFSPERSRRIRANGKILPDPCREVIADRMLSSDIVKMLGAGLQTPPRLENAEFFAKKDNEHLVGRAVRAFLHSLGLIFNSLSVLCCGVRGMPYLAGFFMHDQAFVLEECMVKDQPLLPPTHKCNRQHRSEKKKVS